MNHEQLIAECNRLIYCETIEDSLELLNIYSEFLLLAVKNHHTEDVYSQADADAKLIIQMMMSKTLHLRNVIDGISFASNDGKPLAKIIDPTVVAIISEIFMKRLHFLI